MLGVEPIGQALTQRGGTRPRLHALDQERPAALDGGLGDAGPAAIVWAGEQRPECPPDLDGRKPGGGGTDLVALRLDHLERRAADVDQPRTWAMISSSVSRTSPAGPRHA